MAGSQRLSGDDGKSNGQRKPGEKRSGGQQCGENITGVKCRCAVCLYECIPILPDNCTPIPVCESCWKQIGASNKLMIVTFTRNTLALEGLTHMIQEYLANRGIYAGRLRPERPGEGN